MAALPKETYRLIPNHIKYPMTFCTQIEEKTFKLYGSTKYQEYSNQSEQEEQSSNCHNS
jgi:hypothetical protein